MKISAINNTLSFKSSNLNILAMADNHGSLLSMPVLMTAIQENKHDIFRKSDEQSTQNVFAIAGDYFINPQLKNLLTKPDKTNGDLQYDFLLKTIETAKNTAGQNSNFDTVFTPGNHCLEGGDKWLFNKIKDAPMTTILSNVNLSKSPLFEKLMKENDNIVTSKIYEITDDKNPDIKNHALFLGVTIPREKFNSRKLEGTTFYDSTHKNDILMGKEDLQKTFKVLNYQIENFKEKYPNGAVILLSHMGNLLSRMIAEEVPNINVILNGHDHKKTDTLFDRTAIISLGKNNNLIKSVNIEFDDSAKHVTTTIQKYDVGNYNEKAQNNEELQGFVNDNLAKDIEPLLVFDKDNIPETMKFSKKIRYENCDWVNYITDSIKESIKMAYPKTDLVGIPSEIFRGGLKDENNRNEFNNLDMIRLFAGANENLSALKIGTIKGNELFSLALENTLNNIKNPERRGMIQWSDLQINRTLIKQIKDNESNEDIKTAIKIRDEQTGKFEPIDMEKEYSVVLPDKYLLKDTPKVQVPFSLHEKFGTIQGNLNSYFKEYLELNEFNFDLDGKSKEQRIL